MARTGRPISAQTAAIRAGKYSHHVCTSCGVVHPFTPEHFPRQSHEPGGLRKVCRPCFRKQDRGRSRQRVAEWRKENPAAYRRAKRRRQLRRYGLSWAQYEELLRKQDGRCAVCGHSESMRNEHDGGIKNLHVDHCHATGRVRGLLCGRCNLALGHLRENPDTCRKLAAYIEGGAHG